MFDSARTCTPIQRFVYVFAKNEHGPDPPDESEGIGDSPGGFNKAQQFQDSTSKFR